MIQYCSFCKNHGFSEPKKGHKPVCPFVIETHWKNCQLGCLRTRLRQISVAEEKKFDYKMEKRDSAVRPSNMKRTAKTCRKCRRHGKSANLVQNHAEVCPFMSCGCVACKITDKRRANVSSDLSHTRLQRRKQTSMYGCFHRVMYSASLSTDSGVSSLGSPEVLSPWMASQDREYSIEANSPEVSSFASVINSPNCDMIKSVPFFTMSTPSPTQESQNNDTTATERDLDSFINQLDDMSHDLDDFDFNQIDFDWDWQDLDQTGCMKSKRKYFISTVYDFNILFVSQQIFGSFEFSQGKALKTRDE